MIQKLKRIAKWSALIFATWFGVHTIYTISDGLSDNGTNADLAVVLGNKVNADGTLSERLKQRLTCSLELYKLGRVRKILVSGGLGSEGFYEGDKMRQFLMDSNVPDSLIIVDNFGDNTLATVRNTLKLKNQIKFKTLIIVSQYFHITRTKMLFRKEGFNNVTGVSPSYFEFRDVYSLVREFGAYYTEY
jgi:vancomycin permeability regulator SanA